MKQGYFYIMSNFTRTVFYSGVTSQLQTRVGRHKDGIGSVFTKKYRCKYLVYYEIHPTIVRAIEREKQVKNWHRDWKIALIKKMNPEMRDLSDEI